MRAAKDGHDLTKWKEEEPGKLIVELGKEIALRAPVMVANGGGSKYSRDSLLFYCRICPCHFPISSESDESCFSQVKYILKL